MAQPTSLFVPIDLEAFCVGIYDVQGTKNSPAYGTQNFARLANDFSNLPYLDGQGQIKNGKKAALSHEVLPGYFNLAGSSGNPLEVGVHLHWALPDALTQGESTGEGPIEFPEVPNRWLVVRMVEVGSQPEITAWVVTSDELWDKEGANPDQQNQQSRAVPLAPVINSLPTKSFSAMGRVTEYSSWQEPVNQPAISKNTALGYGVPTYAAVYAHSQNVFGFYDPLQDHAFDPSDPTASANITYFVTGWYSDAAKDPLAQLPYPDKATYEQQLALLEKTYKWAFTPDANLPFPTDTLCHGLVYDLVWEPGKVYVKPRPQGDISVAIGNNTAEAMSALLANESSLSQLTDLEQVLNVLQQGLLAQFDQAGGLGKAEEKLHEAAFGRTSAGPIWLVKRKDADKAQRAQNPSQKDIANSLLNSAGGLNMPIPDLIAEQLDELNTQQIGVDRLKLEIETRESQLFVDWYKYMNLEYPGGSSPPSSSIDVNHARSLLKTEAAAISGPQYNGQGGQKQMLAELQAGVNLLKAQLEQDLTGLELELVSVPSPRYYHGMDPVVLIAGADVEPPQRHGGDGRFDDKGRLLCRITGQLIHELDFHAGGQVSATIKANQLPPLVGPATSPKFVDQIGALFAETIFIVPQNASLLAQLAQQPGASTKIAAAQRNLLSGQRDQNQAVTFAGSTPSPLGQKNWGGSAGTNPWVPLMMQWEVYFDPTVPIRNDEIGTETSYKSDFITANFQPNDAAMPIELVGINPPPNPWTSLQTYKGSILLTSNTEIKLKEEIKKFVKNYPQDAHVAELDKILAFLESNKLPRQSQALSGLNQALVMREQTLQLPVNDPLASPSKVGLMIYRFINEQLPAVIGDHNVNAPLVHNYFNPLRAGSMKISRIRVIDAFGQILDIDSPKTLVAKSMQAPGNTTPNLAYLPPRITQPSRLLFRWLAAADNSIESNSHPMTTPIFGWVLFNHLDDALVIYDGDGNALGSFNIQGPIWQGAPGDAGSYGHANPTASLNALPDTPANDHLKNFVNGVYNKLVANKNRDYLQAMLTAIDRSVTSVAPGGGHQTAGLSVLIGRPLALTRASLKLELDGLPLLDQSWNSFAAAVKGGNIQSYTEREHAAFDQVKFPVQIGDLSQVSDGLIGYFQTDQDDSDPTAYETFYAHAIAGSSETGKGVIAPDFNHLQLTPSYGVESKMESVPGQAGQQYRKVVGQTNENSLYLTMLLDPRASIHATTGILPTRFIDIPPNFYTRALENMAVTFLTPYLLSSAHEVSIPLPKEPGFDWSWITNQNDAWSQDKNIKKVNTKAAFNYPPQQVQEGWLKLQAEEEEDDNNQQGS